MWSIQSQSMRAGFEMGLKASEGFEGNQEPLWSKHSHFCGQTTCSCTTADDSGLRNQRASCQRHLEESTGMKERLNDHFFRKTQKWGHAGDLSSKTQRFVSLYEKSPGDDDASRQVRTLVQVTFGQYLG